MPFFFLIVVPIVGIIFAFATGIRSIDPNFELVILVTALYTMVFLVIVGLLPNRQTDSQIETDRTDPHNRIEPRF